MSGFDAHRLWLLQLRLECKDLDKAHRIVRIDGDNPDEIPTCSVARFHDGFAIVFGSDADDELVEQAAALSPELFFEDGAFVAAHLGVDRDVRMSRCRTYAFSDTVMAGWSRPHGRPRLPRKVGWGSTVIWMRIVRPVD